MECWHGGWLIRGTSRPSFVFWAIFPVVLPTVVRFRNILLMNVRRPKQLWLRGSPLSLGKTERPISHPDSCGLWQLRPHWPPLNRPHRPLGRPYPSVNLGLCDRCSCLELIHRARSFWATTVLSPNDSFLWFWGTVIYLHLLGLITFYTVVSSPLLHRHFKDILSATLHAGEVPRTDAPLWLGDTPIKP